MLKKFAMIIGMFMLYIGVSQNLPFLSVKRLREMPSLDRMTMIVARSDGAQISFEVSLARTLKEQERGLMFVRSMPEMEGMAFLYSPPKNASFWMKNTYIPLDILFISPGGKIQSIKKNAKPGDLTPIQSQGVVEAVVELNAGIVDKYGIKEGDRVGVAPKKGQ